MTEPIGHDPRPTKQEWEGWLPPVGVECEAKAGSEWRRVEIKAISGKAMWIYDQEYLQHAVIDPAVSEQFRPLKSKQESQREELEELLSEYSFDIGEDYSKAADAILSRYNLDPKP